jgi:hypothetical protein
MTAGAFALLMLGVASCGSPGSGGTGNGSSETGESAAPTSSEALAVDPCQTLTQADLAELGAEGPGVAKHIAGAPVCDFKLSSGGVVSVGANNDKSVDQLNFTGGKVDATTVGSVNAKLVRELAGRGSCGVAFPTSPSTSFLVTSAVPRDTEAACQKAQEAAPLVAANISKS